MNCPNCHNRTEFLVSVIVQAFLIVQSSNGFAIRKRRALRNLEAEIKDEQVDLDLNRVTCCECNFEGTIDEFGGVPVSWKKAEAWIPPERVKPRVIPARVIKKRRLRLVINHDPRR